MNGKVKEILVVDIGGSHATAAIVSVEKKCILEGTLKRIDINAQGTPDDVLNSWAGLILETGGNKNLHIGMAIAGPFNYEEGVSLMKGQNKFDNLYGLNIKKQLAQRLNADPDNIRMQNDAYCFLSGHFLAGILERGSNILGLPIGTGIGSILSIDNEYRSPEYWKAPFEDSIADDYLSSRWLVKEYNKHTEKPVTGVKEMKNRIAYDMRAQYVFDVFGNNLGKFICDKDPDVSGILLGGNISKAYPCFERSFVNKLKAEGKSYKISVSKLGEDAMLLGAASLWLE